MSLSGFSNGLGSLAVENEAVKGKPMKDRVRLCSAHFPLFFDPLCLPLDPTYLETCRLSALLCDTLGCSKTGACLAATTRLFNCWTS